MTPRTLGAVAVGGALGAVARWGLGEVTHAATTTFPWTTFGINVAGALLLALLPALAFVRRSPVAVAFLGPGVLGGFTTLSAYAEETRELLADGRADLAGAYVLGTLACCLVVVTLASRWTAHSGEVDQ